MARRKNGTPCFQKKGWEGHPPRPIDGDHIYWQTEFMATRREFGENALPLDEVEANELWRGMMPEVMDDYTWRELLDYAEQAIEALDAELEIISSIPSRPRMSELEIIREEEEYRAEQHYQVPPVDAREFRTAPHR